MRREVYTISVRDKVVCAWKGVATEFDGDIYTDATVTEVTVTTDDTRPIFFVSPGLAKAVAEYVGGEIEVYQYRDKLSEA